MTDARIPSKSVVRNNMRAVLTDVSPDQWRAAAEPASRRLMDAIASAHAQTVLFYMPTPKELDVGPAAQECLRRGIRVCLPRAAWNMPRGLQDPSSPAITPALITAWTREQLVEIKYGIWEPTPKAPTVDLPRLDLIVVPGLVFDLKGGRLGRGGGFYDRFLSQLGLTATKVGVGLDEQVIAEEVPKDAWDVTLDALVTPTRTLVFGRGG
jgi:5-formyltetrahydrofolate cyclo-ligase